MAIDGQWYVIQYASKELQIEFDYEVNTETAVDQKKITIVNK